MKVKSYLTTHLIGVLEAVASVQLNQGYGKVGGEDPSPKGFFRSVRTFAAFLHNLKTQKMLLGE